RPMAMKLSPRRTAYLVGDPADGFAVVAGPAVLAVVAGPAGDLAVGALPVLAGLAVAVVCAFVVVAVAVLVPPAGITRRRPATIRWGLASPFALARAVAPTR